MKHLFIENRSNVTFQALTFFLKGPDFLLLLILLTFNCPAVIQVYLPVGSSWAKGNYVIKILFKYKIKIINFY